jgi:hypothetical protein
METDPSPSSNSDQPETPRLRLNIRNTKQTDISEESQTRESSQPPETMAGVSKGPRLKMRSREDSEAPIADTTSVPMKEAQDEPFGEHKDPVIFEAQTTEVNTPEESIVERVESSEPSVEMEVGPSAATTGKGPWVILVTLITVMAIALIAIVFLVKMWIDRSTDSEEPVAVEQVEPAVQAPVNPVLPVIPAVMPTSEVEAVAPVVALVPEVIERVVFAPALVQARVDLWTVQSVRGNGTEALLLMNGVAFRSGDRIDAEYKLQFLRYNRESKELVFATPDGREYLKVY